jgi:NAD(P)H dehydrogenase (quinone)
MIGVDDIGAFAAKAFAAPEQFKDKAIELAGDAVTFPRIAEILSEISGKPITYEPVSGPIMMGILRGAGLDEGTAGFVTALDENTAAGLLSGCTGELSALIGRPTTPLKEGLGMAMES